MFHPTDLTPNELVLRRSSGWVQYMSISKLTQLLRLDRGGNRDAAELNRHIRITEPINNIVMLLLGLPFILSRERNIKASVTLCVLMCVMFYTFIYICRYMGLSATLHGIVTTCDRLGLRVLPSCYVINRWVDLGIATFIFTMAAIVAIKYIGFRKRFCSAKRAMIAAGYEILLYRRAPLAVIGAEVKLVWNNIKCLLFLAPSLGTIGLLYVLISGSLSNRYDYAPFGENEDIVISTTHADPSQAGVRNPMLVSKNPELEITARVRNDYFRKTWTRLRANQAGVFELMGQTTGNSGPTIVVGRQGAIPRADQFINGVHYHVDYPTEQWCGRKRGWMFFFFGGSLIGTFPLMQLLRIRM